MQLIAIVDEHPTEVEYEVLARGGGRRLTDLGTPMLGWRDLYVLLRHAPEDSPLMRARLGCGHSPTEHIGLLQLHSADVGNWQRSAGKKTDYPKPPACLDGSVSTEKVGSGAMTLEETAAWLGWTPPRPAA